jgi:SAM-dependent methyltransferase
MSDSTRSSSSVSERYWGDVASRWSGPHPFRVWREFTDLHQWGMVASWLGRGPAEWSGDRRPVQLLKTDLFDEIAGRGIAPRLLASGVDVTSIDVCQHAVETARARNPGLKAVMADVRRLPFADGSFDAVYSGSTLDHFDSENDIHAAISELRRVLRPGGRLLLTMDNAANPIIRIRNGPLLQVLRMAHVVPYHVGITFTPAALREAVTRSGFEVIEMVAVMHCPRVLAVALSRLLSVMPRPMHNGYFHCLSACERLDRLPTRWQTGHYIAIEGTVPGTKRPPLCRPAQCQLP